MAQTKWSEDEVERVALLLEQGLTSKEIGDLIGRGKGSVVSAVKRYPRLASIGFFHQPVAVAPRAARRRKNSKRIRIVAHNPNGVEIMIERQVRRISMMELSSTTCRWPLDDPARGQAATQTFCGNPCRPDQPYCNHHTKKSVQPPRERNRR